MTLNKLSIVAFTLALSAVNFLQTEAAQAEDTFAVILYSKVTGGYRAGYLGATAEDAALAALKIADDRTAHTAEAVVWVRNGYAALALGDDLKVYGAGWGSTPLEAKLAALKEASKLTRNCYIAVCVHSETGLVK